MKVINYFKNVFINLFTGVVGLTLLVITLFFLLIGAIGVVIWNIITGKPNRIKDVTMTVKELSEKLS